MRAPSPASHYDQFAPELWPIAEVRGIFFLGAPPHSIHILYHQARRRVFRYYTRLYPVEYTLRYSTG